VGVLSGYGNVPPAFLRSDNPQHSPTVMFFEDETWEDCGAPEMAADPVPCVDVWQRAGPVCRRDERVYVLAAEEFRCGPRPAPENDDAK
jgi:hypothetical protein